MHNPIKTWSQFFKVWRAMPVAISLHLLWNLPNYAVIFCKAVVRGARGVQ